MRVSDPRRAVRPAFGVTGISDDRYRTIVGVIVISLTTPWSARGNCGCTLEHLRGPEMNQGGRMT